MPRHHLLRAPVALRLMHEVSSLMRLLVLTMLAFNVGFYLVLPFLAVHLTNDVGVGAALVGAVLGLRVLAQQGLFVVGGLLADRFGTRPLLLAGIGLRVGSFLLLAASTSLAVVTLAVVALGVAGALFTPAVEAEVAREATRQAASGGPARTDCFALLTVASEVGALVGPVLGAVLLVGGFRLSCLLAAAVFTVALVVHVRLLPRGTPTGQPAWTGLREVLALRPFVLFAAAFGGYLATYNQLYLALPLELDRVSGPPAATGWLFAASALAVILLQLRVTRAARSRTSAAGCVIAGFTCLAAGPATMAAFRHAVASPGAPAMLVACAAFVALVTLGQMLLLPASRDVVARLVEGRLLGTAFGLVGTAGGLAVVGSSALTGGAFDAIHPTGPGRALPWLVITAVPLAAAVALTLLDRTHPVPPEDHR